MTCNKRNAQSCRYFLEVTGISGASWSREVLAVTQVPAHALIWTVKKRGFLPLLNLLLDVSWRFKKMFACFGSFEIHQQLLLSLFSQPPFLICLSKHFINFLFKDSVCCCSTLLISPDWPDKLRQMFVWQWEQLGLHNQLVLKNSSLLSFLLCLRNHMFLPFSTTTSQQHKHSTKTNLIDSPPSLQLEMMLLMMIWW